MLKQRRLDVCSQYSDDQHLQTVWRQKVNAEERYKQHCSEFLALIENANII